MLNVIRSMYAYQTWANDRLFTTAAQVSTELWIAPRHPSVGSLRDLMTHIVSCERGWINFVQRREVIDLRADDFASVAALRASWQTIAQTTDRYLDSLDDAALERLIPWTGTDGETHDYPQWKMLFHQANHAMQHRSEAALILTELGATCDWMDYFIFVSWEERPWLRAPA